MKLVLRPATHLSLIIFFTVIGILTMAFSYEAVAMSASGNSGLQEQIAEHSQLKGEQAEKLAAAETHSVAATGHGQGHVNLGEFLPLWSCIPFACMLLSIALFPLVMPEFWHHHFGKVSAFWAASLGVPFLIAYKGLALYEILHIILADYVPFIILLWLRNKNYFQRRGMILFVWFMYNWYSSPKCSSIICSSRGIRTRYTGSEDTRKAQPAIQFCSNNT